MLINPHCRFLKKSFLAILISSSLFCDSIAFFTPPKDWECVKSKNLPEAIEIGFLKKGPLSFRPSLNLAKEKVSVSLKEYLSSVRKLHEKELKVQWCDLGDFFCRAGKGRLAEIRSSSSGGELRMLQAIFLSDGWAYILTGAAKKEDFPLERGILLNALRSLSVVPDLFTAIPEEKRRTSLKEQYDSLNLNLDDEEKDLRWKNLAQTLSDYEDLGTYWLFLALKEGRERIYGN